MLNIPGPREIYLSIFAGICALMLVSLYSQPSLASAQSQSPGICSTVSEIPLAECQALVALYDETDGTSWNTSTDWLVTSTPCSWYGVTCGSGHVIRLALPNNRLTGSIPAQLGNLTSLKELLLYNNQLSGPIPFQLGGLATLQQLWLAVNQLSGPIPAELGNLSALVALRLEYNAIEGVVPASLTRLVNLHTEPYSGLNIAYNQLTATEQSIITFLNEKDPDWNQSQTVPPLNIVATVKSIGSIELAWTPPNYQGAGGSYEIHLSTTSGGPYTWHGNTADKTAASYLVSKLEPGTTYYFVLRTRTPAHGSQQNALQSDFSVEIPAITPSVPADFCAGVTGIPMEECRALQLLFAGTAGTAWQNSTGWVTTSAPCDWWGVTCRDAHVVELDLAANDLAGTVPVELGNLTNLEALYLERNDLIGPLPSELGKLINLQELYLAENRLDGSIPSELGQLSNLRALDLNSNQLSGDMPPEIGLLSQLEGLWLDTNQLSGNIPSELGKLGNLQTLWLFNNRFQEAIPDAIGDLGILRDLRLHGNQLSGAIPNTIGKLTRLKRLYLHDNQLNGTIPPSLGALANLERLYLYQNQLSGVIPSEVGNLTALTWLQLHSNQLTGEIPPELGNLSSLEWLNLYDNQLSGSIPWELGTLSALIGLDLHGNRLAGPIPAALGSLSNLNRLNLASNALTGTVPVEIRALASLNELTGADTDLGYNGLTTLDPTVRAFLTEKDPDWVQTQTVPPSGVRATPETDTVVNLSWNPATYIADGGYYEIGLASSPDGPFTVHGTTIDTRTTSYQIGDLSPDRTYYFVMRTYTPAHNGQQNELWSAHSGAVTGQAAVYLPLTNR